MLIAFHTPTLNVRGTCVALYDYALCNETLLGNRSVVVAPKHAQHDTRAFDHFKRRFELLMYDSLDQLEDALVRRDCALFYCIKYGTDDGVRLERVRTAVHCVFTMCEPHGDVYAAVSASLARETSPTALYVPHMVRLKYAPGPSMRAELGIPPDARVVGRYGGRDTFNLPFAKKVLSRMVRARADMWVVLVNTDPWDAHPRIIHLGRFADVDVKTRFLRTLNAFIVPEAMGHTGGLAVLEACAMRLPVLCYNGPVPHRAHIDALGAAGIYFYNEDTFERCLTGPLAPRTYDLRPYDPMRVMRAFRDVFILFD